MDANAKQNPFRRIIYIVCFLHFLFLACLFFKTPFAPAKNPHKPIVVNTVTVKPQVAARKKATPAVSRSASIPAVQKSTAPVKKLIENKPKAKTATAAPVEKKQIQKTKPAPKAEPQPAIPPSLLRELEESIAKIEEKDDKQKKVKKTNTMAIAPLSLQIDAPELAQSTHLDENYIGALTERLHASLHLPEFGEVKIELTLNQDGTVAKLKVLKAESQQNRQYLERELPKLKLPFFSGSYAKQATHAFTLTFCNES